MKRPIRLAAVASVSLCSVTSCLQNIRNEINPPPASPCIEVVQIGPYDICISEDD